MYKLLYFLLLFLLINSCTVKEKPVFVRVDNIKLVSFAADTIRLKANAFFTNPNDVGGKITTEEIKVIINDEEVAQISSDEFKVPAREEFSMPLLAVIPTKRILESNKNGFLGGLLNSVLKKSIKVQLKGNLKYNVFGFSGDYAIDETEDIKIKF
ncbi:hypothetical protein [uncultured Polaribacter sp.]|uniref:hypothetical protein n=1 Tax=uncultured Polaribacter sp. TaxID=174711 RepID=UPI002615D2F5|nr:hypothetical protein [uncultured Polaribacter sp.]